MKIIKIIKMTKKKVWITNNLFIPINWTKKAYNSKINM